MTLCTGVRIGLPESDEHQFDQLFALNGAFLQFRLAVELFCFSLISARSVDDAKRLGKAFGKDWEVGKILAALNKIDKEFWPEPLTLNLDQENRIVSASHRATNFSGQDLRKLHGKLGGFLHAQRKGVVGSIDPETWKWFCKDTERFREFLSTFAIKTHGDYRFIVDMRWGYDASPQLIELTKFNAAP